jgi:hypothetical protein
MRSSDQISLAMTTPNPALTIANAPAPVTANMNALIIDRLQRLANSLHTSGMCGAKPNKHRIVTMPVPIVTATTSVQRTQKCFVTVGQAGGCVPDEERDKGPAAMAR